MFDINRAIASLAEYGIRNGLLEESDRTYTINRILEKLRLDSFEEPQECGGETGAAYGSSGSSETEKPQESGDHDLQEILGVILDYAAQNGLLGGDSATYRDLFDTEIMNCLLPRPSEIISKFDRLYKESPKAATDYYYAFSRASDYIRTYRVAKDIRWTADTRYGEMIITINLSKPEKDPKAIAAALTMKQSSYPKCQLCRENEGYAGRVDHPARANHRIIPITVNGSPWFLQYSPYVYYNEHCIVFNSEHTPMKIDHAAFDKLLDFERSFPHYCVGSNADLPIVGGSILTHDHFQGGRFEFPMAKAGIISRINIRGFEDVSAGIVDWPMTVIRISGTDRKRLADCADAVLKSWREYTDESAHILAYTEGNTSELKPADIKPVKKGPGAVPHNTITPIARVRNAEQVLAARGCVTPEHEQGVLGSVKPEHEPGAPGAVTPEYELDLVLRNNLTTAEHPLGLYHPHAEHHHIKKENIGLIEVMGLAILPARLKEELAKVREALITDRDITDDPVIGKHSDWVRMIRGKYSAGLLRSEDLAEKIIRDEVALTYSEILEQCAVFANTEQGRGQLMSFIESI